MADKKKDKKMYRISTTFATGAVTVEGRKIIADGTAPIFKKFIGKTLERLKKWLLKKTGEVNSERIYDEEEQNE